MIILDYIKVAIRRIKSVFHKINKHPKLNSTRRKIGRKKFNALLILLGLLIVFLFLRIFVFNNHHKKDAIPPTSVVVGLVRKGDIPIYQNTIGTVTALGSVTVKTQINGRLINVLFEEGKTVQKGELLAQIDPQPYEAVLQQSEGQLIKDQAILENARLDLKRYETLDKQDSVSKQTYDTQKSLVKQFEGIIKTDEGLVESAKVNLEYCRIVSDIDGVIGLRLVNPGNFVQTTDTTPITTINTITPITVIFPVAEDHLPAIQEKFRAKGGLMVDAFDKKGDTLLATGVLTAIDSQISTTTGTINLRATFKNEKFRLYPNQFVNVRLKVDTLKGALIIPNAAIQMGSKGSYVYVINKADNSVAAKQVTVKTTVGLEAAVSGDIQDGQSIVLQGQDKLTDGTIVSAVANKTAPPSKAPK